MNIENFHVVGLQRTGTNWIKTLILKNFYVCHNDTFWKHLTNLNVKSSFLRLNKENGQLDLLNKNYWSLSVKNNVFYISTSKEYNLWLTSLKRNPMDFYISHDTKTSNTELEVYNEWNKWKNIQINNKNFYHKDYVDWLNNWKIYFEEIEHLNKWKRKFSKFKNIEKNEITYPMSTFDVKNYLYER